MPNYVIFDTQTALPILYGNSTLTIASGAGLYMPDLSVTAPTTADVGVRITILGDLLTPQISLSGFDIITVGPDGTFTSVNATIAINFTNINEISSVTNLGTITAHPYATVIKTGGSDIVTNAGTITGGVGVYLGQDALDPAGNLVVNSGTISTTFSAIFVASGYNKIENSGLLLSHSDYAVTILGDADPEFSGFIPTSQSLTNSGQITSTRNSAIFVELGAVDSVFVLKNTGTITGDYASVVSDGQSQEQITNRGTLNGTVDLGDGIDTFDGRGGVLNGDLFTGSGDDILDLRGATINGMVFGQFGNDTYAVSDSGILITEIGVDMDQVFAASSFRLPELVESLFLLGTAANNGFGNRGANGLTGNAGDNRLVGLDGNDTINGDLGNDRLQGGNSNDVLDGQDGDDTVLGGAGADTVRGGDGDDILNGGSGKDAYFGNAGSDIFVFSALLHSANTIATADVIFDFTRGDDIIDLRSIDANFNNAASNDTFVFIGTAAFTNVAGQLRVTQSAGNTYVELDVNGDSAADSMVRINGLLTLNANDFLL